MLYREAGQFKTTLFRGYGDLSDPPGSDRAVRAAGVRLCRRAAACRVPDLAAWQRLHAARHSHPVPDPVAGRDRREHSHRLLRTDLARQRRLHGDRRLQRLQVRHRHRYPAWSGSAPKSNLAAAADGAVDSSRRPDVGVGRHSVRQFPACGSRGSISPSRRWPRSSSSIGSSCASIGSRTTRHQDRSTRRSSGSSATSSTPRSSAISSVWPSSLSSRCSPRTLSAAISAGSGWRSATWTSPPS